MDNNISKEEFQKLLDNHDWYYMMSDDHRLWERGHAQLTTIKKHCNANPEFQEMYQKMGDEMFKTIYA